jgi:large repetitive protein
VSVSPNIPAGTYTVTYELCEDLNPTNCDTATITILVDPSPIVAVDDPLPTVNSFIGGTTPSVLDNDLLHGVVLDPADVTLTLGTAPTPAAGSITMNADGTITVAAGTTAGTYTYPYEICEVLNPANCSTEEATVIVDAPSLAAVDDTPPAIISALGGSTPSVLGNDLLNGVVLDPDDVILTLGPAPTPTAGSITMNSDATITVAAGTTAGTYTYTYSYEICEVVNPAKCATAEATVVVDPSVLLADNDAPAPIPSAAGGTTPSVLANDTLNGVAVDPAAITLTPGTAPAPATGSIIMNPDGTITVAPNTTAGT